jgi:gliding motility-associated-like protein
MSHLKLILATLCLFANIGNSTAQQKAPLWQSGNVYQTDYIIENKGQFELLQYKVKDVVAGVQDKGQKILFTKTGVSVGVYKKQLRANWRDIEENEEKAREMAKKAGHKLPKDKPSEEHELYELVLDFINLEWLGANLHPEVIMSDQSNHYFSYGPEQYKSRGYKTVVYKEMYPHIDIEYTVHAKGGIKYSLLLHPGADLSKVRYRYSSDSKVNVRRTAAGLDISNKMGTIQEQDLVAYYATSKQPIAMQYAIDGNTISYRVDAAIDNSKEIVVDPWVTALTTLNGGVSNVGGFVDFDNAGNLFVYGGSDGYIAKYDPNGVLQWTFNGSVTSISWSSIPSGYLSDLVVDKSSGKIYTGQGFNPATGAIAIRLTTAGIYDNFVSTPSPTLYEFWEMKIDCSNGSLIGMGGSTGSNLNIGVIDTTTGVTTGLNFTGIATWQQDIANAVIDSAGDVYTIMASVAALNVDDHIFKCNSSYTTLIWDVATNYNVMDESANMPGLGASITNGINCLAVNSSYLYYYDGLNLKAFNKATGAAVGTPYLLPATYIAKDQSGITANNCNEVFIGGNNGDILKFSFNGTTFTPLPTLTIPGQANKHIHDLQYNPVNDLIYVAAEGFVATVATNSTCLPPITNQIVLGSTVICPSDGILSVLNGGTTPYTFVWYDTTTQTLVRNVTVPPGVTADTFNNMNTTSVYLVTVIQPTNCQVVSNFVFVKGLCNGIPIYLCPGETYTLIDGTIVSTPGIYTDTLINSSGLDSVITINIINATDTSITNTSFCSGYSYTLPNGTAVFAPGTYYNSYINAEGCDSTIITNVTVLATSSGTQTVDICLGTTYQLPGGQVVGLAGTYKDTFVNAVGCDSIYTTILNTLSPPPYSVSNDTIVCTPGTVLPLVASGGSSVLWSSSTGAVACASCYTQNVAPVVSTQYYMQITNLIGCAAYDTVKVTVVPLNTNLVIPPADTALCEGTNLSFFAFVTGAKPSWYVDFGDGTILNNSSAGFHKYTNPGYYNLQLVATDTLGCSDTIKYLVHVYGKNGMNFTIVDNDLCVGEALLISDEISAYVDDYTHDFGDGVVSNNEINPSHTYANVGNYNVTLTARNAECPDSVLVKPVVVNAYPTVNLGADTSYCDGYSSPILIQNQNNTTGTYLWNTGATSSSIVVSTPGVYHLTLLNSSCSGSDTMLVREDCYLNIPNAFSPNGDNINNYFNPLASLSSGLTRYSMSIYNRWGEKVFTTNSINSIGWDGKYGGKPQPLGVYVYQIECTFKNGKIRTYNGNVTLIR